MFMSYYLLVIMLRQLLQRCRHGFFYLLNVERNSRQRRHDISSVKIGFNIGGSITKQLDGSTRILT